MVFGTSTLPLQISTSITATGTDVPITTAAAPTSFTTVSLTLQSLVTEGRSVLTSTFVTATVVTDPAVYSSLSAAAAVSSPASASSKSHTSSPSSATSTSTALTNSKSSSSNLGTIIPAVVVPILFLLLAVGLGWVLLKRRRKRSSPVEETQNRYDKAELDTTEVSRTHGKQELDTTEVSRTHGRAELYASRRVELPSPGAEKWLVGDVEVHELPGSQHGMAELEGDMTLTHTRPG